MFELTFEVDGKRVDPNRVGDALEAVIIRTVSEKITNKVQAVRCPEHGEYAKVTAKGKSIDKLFFDVTGCCKKLTDAVGLALR